MRSDELAAILFHDPIELTDGRVLRSLRDAGEFIQTLPKATHDRPEWQAAVKALLVVVEHDGDTLPVRIGIVRALNASNPTEPPKATRNNKVIR
jgi:hypothetical protein